MIDDHNRDLVGHALEFLGRVLVERAESILDTWPHGEASRKRDFAPVAHFLPVLSRHQGICEDAAEGGVDVQHDDHRLRGLHAPFGEPLLEVSHAVSVELEGLLAVVLLDGADDRGRHRIVQHELAAHFAYHSLRSIVALATYRTSDCLQRLLDAGRLLGQWRGLILEQDDLAPTNPVLRSLDVVRGRTDEHGLVPALDLDDVSLEVADAPLVVAVFARFATADADALTDDFVASLFLHGRLPLNVAPGRRIPHVVKTG